MSLSDAVRAMEEELASLRSEIALLRERLHMIESIETSDEVKLMTRLRLTRGEAALLWKLLVVRPRAVSRYNLEAAIPSRDHASERNMKIVDVLLCKVRKKLPVGTIETVPGLGWRISPDWHPPE